MRLLPILPALLLCLAAHAGAADHDELDATLLAPYRGAMGEARTFRLVFEHPQSTAPQAVTWRLSLAGADGRVRKLWRGVQQVGAAAVTIEVPWDGSFDDGPAAAGSYRATLVADDIEQGWNIAVGPLAQVPMPPPPADLAAPARWRIVLGNLHSQTGHSDGGGDLASCHGAQEPQASKLGPAEAYAYADRHGLDVLVTSEHNHLFDGATGTNTDADPLAVRALYRSGLDAAARYNASHPGFLGVYGQEWGVIDKGGHLNIFNAPSLLGWERDNEGALLADLATPKGDYKNLYSLMRRQGWVGQFNHPASSGQFAVDGVALGYTADGDAAMALCEVVNTNAFSTSADEGEKRRSIYEGACNRALEAGFHVAFSTNQDNHCANWGMSSTNRTGVLLKGGAALSQASFIEALRARRVFATMDRTASLLFTANGHMMGERFSNRGPLSLRAAYASSGNKTVAEAVIFEGVPGRNGAVTALAQAPSADITPTPGEHFYYARVTQEDGAILWSAPIWVSQQAAMTAAPAAVTADKSKAMRAE